MADYSARAKQEIPGDRRLAQFAVTGRGRRWSMHPLAAAIVEEQLSRYPAIQAGREKFAHYLIDGLARLPGLEPVTPRVGDESSWYALVLKLSDDVLKRVSADDAANDFFTRTLTLPVWHRDSSLEVASQYVSAFAKAWRDLGLASRGAL